MSRLLGPVRHGQAPRARVHRVPGRSDSDSLGRAARSRRGSRAQRGLHARSREAKAAQPGPVVPLAHNTVVTPWAPGNDPRRPTYSCVTISPLTGGGSARGARRHRPHASGVRPAARSRRSMSSRSSGATMSNASRIDSYACSCSFTGGLVHARAGRLAELEDSVSKTAAGYQVLAAPAEDEAHSA